MAEYKAQKAKEQTIVDAAAAKEAKMAAVNKVVQMLSSLRASVVAEGKEEAETYNKFACFCKTKQKDKGADIKKEKNEKVALSADIAKLIKEKGGLENAITS